MNQRALVERWRLFGTPNSILAHIPNGEYRSPATGARLKAMGVMAGMPDFVAVSETSDGVFFLELKKRNGKLSKSQKDVVWRMIECGIRVFLCDDLDSAVTVLEACGVLGKCVSKGLLSPQT